MLVNKCLIILFVLSLESDASNIQGNECFPIDSNVKIAKNTGHLRHSKKICLDNNKI
jgi:hypothetical protein